MRRALPLLLVLPLVAISLAAASLAGEKPVEEQAPCVMEIVIQGVKTGEPEVAEIKAALEGGAVTEVTVDAEAKRVTVRYKPQKTTAQKLLHKLKTAAKKKFQKAKVEALRAELDAPWGTVAASGSVSRDEEAGVTRGSFEVIVTPKEKRVLWGGAAGEPKVEAKPPPGFGAKRMPAVGKTDKVFRAPFAIEGKERPPALELGCDVEVKLSDATDPAKVTPRVVKLIVPMIVAAGE